MITDVRLIVLEGTGERTVKECEERLRQAFRDGFVIEEATVLKNDNKSSREVLYLMVKTVPGGGWKQIDGQWVFDESLPFDDAKWGKLVDLIEHLKERHKHERDQHKLEDLLSSNSPAGKAYEGPPQMNMKALNEYMTSNKPGDDGDA